MLSILLAIQAVDQTRSVDGSVVPEAEEALHRAVSGSREVLSLPGQGVPLDWSASGVFVSEGAEETGLIELRDGDTATIVRRWTGHDGDLNEVAFSRDGSALATTGWHDGMLKVWDPSTEELLGALPGPGEAVEGPSLSEDGSVAAAVWLRAGRPDRVQVLDLSTGTKVWARSFEDDVRDTALSPDGTRLAVTTDDRTGVVYHVSTGARLFRLRAGNGSGPDYGELSWSPDGRSIATTSADGKARVWDAQTGTLRYQLGGIDGLAQAIAWSPDSSQVVAGMDDGTVTIWEAGAKEAINVLTLPARELVGAIHAVAFSPSGAQVMAGGGQTLKIWDVSLNGNAEWSNLPAAWSLGQTVEFLLHGDRVVAPSRDGLGVTIWDSTTGDDLRTLSPGVGTGAITTLDVSTQGDAIVAAFGLHGDARRTLVSWDSATEKQSFAVEDPDTFLDADISADGNFVIYANWTSQAPGKGTVLDRSGHQIQLLTDAHEIARAQFSPDGRLVATKAWWPAAGSARVLIWDWAEAKKLRAIRSAPAGALDFDPTGPRIAILDELSHVEVVDVETGKRVWVHEQPDPQASELTFSPDGTLVAVGRNDGSIRLLDARTGDQRLALPGNDCAVTGLAFSPDGTKLASGHGCGGVRIWALDVDDLLRIARQKVTRSLTDEECRTYLHESPCPKM
jgi:WD40 repeat protein